MYAQIRCTNNRNLLLVCLQFKQVTLKVGHAVAVSATKKEIRYQCCG